MFKTSKEAVVFAEDFKHFYKGGEVAVAVCAPFTQLMALKQELKDTPVKIGAQNMHFAENGAFTGEISADMLTEIGVDYCIIGHSERRQYFGETDQTVNQKLHTAFNHGITPILCVGEVLAERDAKQEFEVVRKQLAGALCEIDEVNASRLVIAYEPVWAIGTGRTATSAQAQEMCAYIRSTIEEMYDEEVSAKVIIQYGGSVKPQNIAELMQMPDIDGALVGGASLKAEEFNQIVNF